jgi:hypothetical protein
VLSSWLRMIFVWGSLKRGLLQPLENSPLRFAFDSLKGSGWLSMFRQSGVREEWKDMARSTESMRHILHTPRFEQLVPANEARSVLEETYGCLNNSIRTLLGHIVSGEEETAEAHFMHAIEKRYQEFSTALLTHILIPYWWRTKHGLVESDTEKPALCKALQDCLATKDDQESEHKTEKRVDSTECSDLIRAAEEFLAIRYVAMIRVVLVNIRFLMLFIAACFVLTIVAWNSYPFQPRQFINWIFTILLLILGTGMVFVLAQMYRDPLLSRIANKRPNELGVEFFVKLVSLGILPVLSWFAYNYPEIGSTLFKLFQPGVSVVK